MQLFFNFCRFFFFFTYYKTRSNYFDMQIHTNYLTEKGQSYFLARYNLHSLYFMYYYVLKVDNK